MHNLRTIKKMKRFMNKLCIELEFPYAHMTVRLNAYILLSLQYVTNIIYTNIQNIYNNTYTHTKQMCSTAHYYCERYWKKKKKYN